MTGHTSRPKEPGRHYQSKEAPIRNNEGSVPSRPAKPVQGNPSVGYENILRPTAASDDRNTDWPVSHSRMDRLGSKITLFIWPYTRALNKNFYPFSSVSCFLHYEFNERFHAFIRIKRLIKRGANSVIVIRVD